MAPQAKPAVSVICPERQEIANRATEELTNTLAMLDIHDWKLPTVNIRFTEVDNIPPARVAAHGETVEVLFSKKCATPEGEKAFIAELGANMAFPGVRQTLKHELAHIAMWSVTGLSRQPAVRLIDEGWASMVEQLGSSKTPDLNVLSKETKTNIARGLKEEPMLYRRCLDLSKPVSQLDSKEELDRLNSAEYEVGKALLLWIRERFGNEKMLQLIAKSPQSSRRNDAEGAPIEPTAIESSLHSTSKEYLEMFDRVTKGALSGDKMIEEGRSWERLQFQRALLETTGMTNIKEVEADFMKWLEE
ncbi:MAG: hypothetical protein V1908_01090 [Candidatus Peregrinibacteria bacterium]